MKTFYEFKYTLNNRMLVGGIRSMSDLKALRSLLMEIAMNESSMLGRASVLCAASDNMELASDLIEMKTKYVGMIEADIMAIDAYVALYERGS